MSVLKLQAITKPSSREIENHYPELFTPEIEAAKAALDSAEAHYRDVLNRATEAIEAAHAS